MILRDLQHGDATPALHGGITYYCCQPQANNHGRPDNCASHPKTAYIREGLLLDALTAFYTDHVLRAHQPDLLIAALERA